MKSREITKAERRLIAQLRGSHLKAARQRARDYIASVQAEREKDTVTIDSAAAKR